MSLTDSWLRSINGKPQEKIITKSDRDGLSVRVTPKGKVIFQYHFRWNSKAERIDIGTYPATSLKDARDSCIFYKGCIEQNKNPKVVKITKKQEAIDACSVSELITEWYEKSLKVSQVKADEIYRSFELHIFPEIGDLPHEEVGLDQWLTLLDEITISAPSIGDRILKYAKKAHLWGHRRGLTRSKPLLDLTSADLGVKVNTCERILNDEELRLLFTLIDSDRYNPRNEVLVKLALLFGCRIGELLKAKYSDFDFTENIWTVPPENHKRGNRSGKPIVRAITPASKALIERAWDLSEGIHLFTTRGGKPMVQGGHLSIVESLNKKMSRNIDGYKTWSIHDLRRTMRTGVSELTAPHVAEIMIGHKLPGVWQVYDKHTYLKDQHEAYEK
ncbi:integrase [Providencia alcalifaciens]|nr:integrase [Providencia alcalifaciens]